MSLVLFERNIKGMLEILKCLLMTSSKTPLAYVLEIYLYFEFFLPWHQLVTTSVDGFQVHSGRCLLATLVYHAFKNPGSSGVR